MAYRTSISGLAFLALLGGCFGPGGTVARGGDKIEFSAPGILLDVPQQEREIKQEVAPSLGGSFQGQGAVDPSFMQVPPPVVIIPAQKGRDGFGWHSPFGDDQDRDDGSALDLFAPKSAPAHTNSWTSSDDKDRDFRNGTLTEFTPDISRSGPDSERDGGFRGEFGNRFSDRGGSDLSRAFSSHGPIAEARIHEGEFVPGNEEFRAMYGQQGSGFSEANPLSQPDPLHTSAYSSSSPGNYPADEIPRDQTGQPSGMQPSMMQAWDVPAAAPPQRRRDDQQSVSAQNQGPSAPAVLVWPKRPGDMFQ